MSTLIKNVTRSGWLWDAQGNAINIASLLTAMNTALGGVDTSDLDTIDYEDLTITTVAGLSGPSAGNATSAVITVEGDDARYRVDGTAAAANSGHTLRSGDVLTLTTANEVTNFSCISTGSTVLRVSYIGTV